MLSAQRHSGTAAQGAAPRSCRVSDKYRLQQSSLVRGRPPRTGFEDRPESTQAGREVAIAGGFAGAGIALEGVSSLLFRCRILPDSHTWVLPPCVTASDALHTSRSCILVAGRGWGGSVWRRQSSGALLLPCGCLDTALLYLVASLSPDIPGDIGSDGCSAAGRSPLDGSHQWRGQARRRPPR